MNESADGQRGTYRLTNFELGDMTRCGREVRALGTRACMEDAAQALVEYLRGVFVGEGGMQSCPLVRCFKTHALGRLPEDLATAARGAIQAQDTQQADVPCLTLLGSSGALVEWNGRRRSRGHRAIPLESEAVVERAPMIAQLIQGMGLAVSDVLAPSPGFLLDAEQRSFKVFHVAQAKGSRFVQAQRFVEDHAIASVLGFGGLLPSGDLFAVILFSSVAITEEVAAMFSTIALSTKLLLLPFSHGPVFREEVGTGHVLDSAAAGELQRAEIATLRLLLPAQEELALQQTKKLQDALSLAESANLAKSQFLANMSHELRTPLSAVIGYSELLEEELEGSDERGLLKDIRKIQSNARHLLSLINNVLDLSKIEAERMTMYAETFDVETLVHEVADTLQGLVEQKGNTLTVEAGPELGLMDTDLVKVRQCLFNLVSNASKFTENGTIMLRVSSAGDEILFRVEDNGIGMTPEQTTHLFERFRQGDDSTTRRFGGTGLGLAITRGFCKLLGGDVEVASTFGQGSTFLMRIPRKLPGQPEPMELSPQPAEGKQVVLVIDDDPAQRELLTRFLEREGFAVRLAADGRTGIELARAIRPRAILLDVLMPQMDGWAVLSAIKADPEIEHTPVVMVTFVNEPGLSDYLGATDTVLKPVEWNRLKNVMERFRDKPGDILVVDDERDNRHLLRTILEADGWIVSEAENGREALDIVLHAPPKVVLLDLTMPVMDGFTFMDQLRSRPGCADIPVVVYTARLMSAEEEERLAGAARVLRKGEIDLRQLAGELKEVAPALGATPPE